MPSVPPQQAGLPKKQVRMTDFQRFTEPSFARVTNTDAFHTQGKISVTFLNRTSPVPIWVLDPGLGKPEVGDFVVVGYLDGQKNNPYMQGIVAHKAYTSNFIRVEKSAITIQFPLQTSDITGTSETDPKNHLRDDTKLSTRAYVKIDATGITLHAPTGLAVNVQADTVLIKDHGGSGTPQPVARVGDSVSVSGATGTITSGSSTLKSI